MKKNLLLISFLLIAAIAISQHLVPGSIDVVGLSGYPSDPHLVEADAQSFYWISGSDYSIVNHPLLPEVYNDFANVFFIKYDREGAALKSNYIRGVSRAQNAFSFKGGLTVVGNTSHDVEASGQVIPIAGDDVLEFIATYDQDCQLVKIINIWDLLPGTYVFSEARMDPKDGSVYIFGTASTPLELLGFGTLGKDVSASYFYLVKYNQNLDLEWAYTAGFDMDASGTSPYFNKINIHPGNEGDVLVTGSYGSESSPLINDISLPPYTDGYGMFAVMLNAIGTPQWVQDGPMNGYGYATAVFEGFPMPDGDFVLAGVTNTGYFKLGNAEFIFPGGESFENQFVYRMEQNGNIVWSRALHNMRPNQDKKKKSAQSEVFDSYLNYDAINWRDKILYLAGIYNTTTGFSVAGETLDQTYGEGIFVAALDMDDGSEFWGWGITSDYVNLFGFDADRTGNVSLMGYNYMTQQLQGWYEKPVGVSDFLFHVGLNYDGYPFWYDNINLLNGPNYYRLNGVDMEVLPNGEVFSSMYMTEVNSLVIEEATVPGPVDTYSSWLVELVPDIIVGGLVSDGTGSPVYPGLVRAIKSAPWGSYPVADSTLINDDGSYQFTDLYPGKYAFKAIANPVQYPDGIPTYFKNRVEWTKARLFDIAPDTFATHLDIELVEVPKFTSMDGSGQLSGSIYTEEEYGLKGTMAKPARKTGVILLGKAKKSTMAGEVFAYVETDESGMFLFDYVPDGEYILVVDVAGLEMLSTHEVTIVGSQIVSGLNYTLGEDGIYAGWPTAVSFLENKTLDIWPNPGEGLIMMDLPAAGEYVVRIYSADGRLIRTDDFRSAGGVTTLDISEVNRGLYILSIKGPETTTTRKYIKK